MHRVQQEEFFENHQLQQQYTVEVLNRFHILAGDEDPRERYHRFVEGNRQAMDQLVVNKQCNGKANHSIHPQVIKAI